MRIASLSPAVTEILFALGKGSEVVCTDQFSNFPEEVRDLPHLRDHVKVKPDDLREFQPDLIFTSTVIQDKLAAQLKEQGFGVIHQDPRTINTIYESIRQIGMLVGAEKEAGELVLKMQQGFNDVKEKARHLPRKPRVYVEEWPSFAPLRGATAGRHPSNPFASGNWVPEVARIAGCEQFPIPFGELSREVTLDEVIRFDPDIIVISWCGAGSLADPELLKKREGWDVLRAVQQGNVRVIDDSLLNRPGPRLVEGAQRLYGWAFELLH